MNKVFSGIMLVSVSICLVCAALVVSVFSYRYITQAFIVVEQPTNQSQSKGATSANEKHDSPIASFHVPATQKQRNGLPQLLVMIAEEDERMARQMADSGSENSRAPDGDSPSHWKVPATTGKVNGALNEVKDESTSGVDVPDGISKGKKKIPTILDVLSNIEKNTLWWRIADAAQRSDQYSFTLTVDAAAPFARECGVSVLTIFNFFREGSSAQWNIPRDLEDYRRTPGSFLPVANLGN